MVLRTFSCNDIIAIARLYKSPCRKCSREHKIRKIREYILPRMIPNIRYLSYFVVASLYFSESTYNINENAGPLQPVLIFNAPSSPTFTIQVFSTTSDPTIGENTV